MIKALVIVPYEGLYEMMKEIQQEVDDIQFDIELGNLYEGVAIAKEAENSGYHVIISRGGTASLIQEVVSIPVIDIQVSGYDVLRIITLVKGFSRKAAIVGFSNITQGAGTVCKLLDLDIKTLTITKDTEVKEKLSNLKKLDYEVVIGDVVTVQAAKQLGLTGVLITSGKEAIFDALEETRRTFRIFSKLQQEVSVFKAIFDHDERAIAVFNHEEEMIYRNEMFSHEFQWLNLENSADIKMLIQETIVTRKKQTKTVHIHQFTWELTAIPEEEAVVLFLEKKSHHRADEKDNNMNAVEFRKTASYVPISGKSDPILKVVKQIDQYSKSENPVWISGEEGNGKELVSHSLYLKRKSMNEPFIVLHCELLSTKQFKDLIDEDFFEHYSDAVIFLKNIDKLTMELQREVCNIVKDEKNRKKVKWVASSESNMEEKIREEKFSRELYETLGIEKINIPPLRERREDIEDLVHVFISELHPKYGNEVVGIRQDALKEIVNYDWPGNVEQLKKVIEQLFLQTSSYYIEKEDVEKVLKRLEQPMDKFEELTSIDISGTLEEIERQVLTKVLEEEGLNQSKAAKRLGINRTTLWRKLKS